MPDRKLRVFLCHASQDKPVVRELYQRLLAEGWIDPWLDEENLLPGQDFDFEINKATREADAIIICLSKVSVAKEGYVNKEIRRALDIAEEKPEGTIYVIPLRLDDCTPSFEQLKKLQWADYFTPNAHEKLIRSLKIRAKNLNIGISLTLAVVADKTKKRPSGKLVDSLKKLSLKSSRKPVEQSSFENLDLCKFVQIPPTDEIRYPFAIGKYPVTNAQYERFLNAPDFGEKSFWIGFPKFDDNCLQIGKWERKECDNWIQEEIKFVGHMPRPFYWDDKNFGIANPDNPVVYVSWFEANAYCKWLMHHWGELTESRANPDLHVLQIRLPLDFEWSIAAGGEIPVDRYPWDTPGSKTEEEKEIVRRANVLESRIGHTTPVNAYLRGASPHGVMDMAGNVWEWQANYQKMEKGWLSLRSGSWNGLAMFSCVSIRNGFMPIIRDKFIGFRVACII